MEQLTLKEVKHSHKKLDYIDIYSDGACSNNPGIGGWGAVLIWKDKAKEIYGYEMSTTNNRMEMKAAIEALKSITKCMNVNMYTDSKYLKDGITIWIKKWQLNNWNNSKVKNIDLWMELLKLTNMHQIKWVWVKGHNGDKYNELADKLAKKGIKEAELATFHE